MTTIRGVAYVAFIALLVAVTLTVLDADHLGVLRGGAFRAVHDALLYAGFWGNGWVFGALRYARRPQVGHATCNHE